MNEKLVITLINALDWTNISAGFVFDSDAGLGNHIFVHAPNFALKLEFCR